MMPFPVANFPRPSALSDIIERWGTKKLTSMRAVPPIIPQVSYIG